jgi:hypothetical protein
MPHGGRRPGAGAPAGNTNALRTGGRSRAAETVLAALLTHPNVRAIFRLLIERGLWPPPFKTNPLFRGRLGQLPAATQRDLRRAWAMQVVRCLYPALVDCSHPAFNQINQPPESGWPTPWPGPRFTEQEFLEMRDQSKRRHLDRPSPTLHPSSSASSATRAH